jgi:GTP pyrophosphokinase
MDVRTLLDRAKPFYSENQLYEIEDAVHVASKAHEGQKRRSGEPYITHPLAVAAQLIDWGMDSDTVIAGILHDTVEDTALTIPEIETKFGADVAFLVDGVTKVSKARAGMRDLDSYLPQTKDNLSKLLIAVGQDIRVIIIKLADRLHNMQTLQYKSVEKQKKIARETLEVFAPLADRLNMGRVRVQLEELSFKYLNPDEYNRTKRLMESRLKKSQRRLSHVRHAVDRKLTEEKIPHEIDGRVKSVYSLYKKLDRVGNIDDVYDLIALRIIVDDIETCYLVLGVLHAMYTPVFERIKDYIAQPKPNGYQSLHTTVTTKEGQIVEFQIRTHEMHFYAERGLAASFHYNEQKLTDDYKRKTIAELPADLAWIHNLQIAAAKAREGKKFSADDLKLGLFSDRIFIYSPKGDIYDLPHGSLPLDFAYRVHSDVAARASGFMVNGVMKPFDYPLSHGDTVEVLTSKSAKPKPDWASLVTTPHAKDKLRGQLRRSGGILYHIAQAKKLIPRRRKK